MVSQVVSSLQFHLLLETLGCCCRHPLISQIATHLYQCFTLRLVRGSTAPKVHLIILRPPREAVSSSTIVVVLVLVADSQPYDFCLKITYSSETCLNECKAEFAMK